jgi:integrase
MRALMGLIKDRHGTYCAQQKVPERLQAAVALVLGNGKPRQVYLKKSLGTKDLRTANVYAKLVLAGFDRTIRDATAIAKRPTVSPPLRASLSEAEIARMAEYVFAKTLAWDERFRVGGRDEQRRAEAWLQTELEKEGRKLGPVAYPHETLPQHGWSPAQLQNNREQLEGDLNAMRHALALGDVSAVEDHVMEALDAFGIDLAPGSLSRPLLGIAVMRAYVRALQAIEQRNAGEPVDTPRFAHEPLREPLAGGTLREAQAGWERQRPRPPQTIKEYSRSVEMFIQLHGDLRIADLKRSHVREFREALQDTPSVRKGALLKASLPELSAWGRKHPEAPKIAAATANKQLGAVQAIAVWGSANGLVPEDAGWTDPFSKMRLTENQSDRVPFELMDLQRIFNAPVFNSIERPVGAKGVAGVWLPLVALYTGARQAEIAGLMVADVLTDSGTAISYLMLTEQAKVGKRLKTKMSQRAIPVHSGLVALGFLDYVKARARFGENAWLFPTVAPDQKGAVQAWSKWWGRYLRVTVGVEDTAKVFHSFRHGWKDAARAGEVSLELHDALMGQTNASAVSQGYGAKQMLQRFGLKALSDAVEKVRFPGLDLSKVRTGYEERK